MRRVEEYERRERGGGGDQLFPHPLLHNSFLPLLLFFCKVARAIKPSAPVELKASLRPLEAALKIPALTNFSKALKLKHQKKLPIKRRHQICSRRGRAKMQKHNFPDLADSLKSCSHTCFPSLLNINITLTTFFHRDQV